MKTIFSLFLALGMTFSASAFAANNNCIFGTDLDEMEANSRLEIQSDVVRTFKKPRMVHHKELVMVSIAIVKDKVTKRVFHVNTTFRHTDDGDNTLGWIEEVTGADEHDGGVANEGNLVALIGDSEIYKCTANK